VGIRRDRDDGATLRAFISKWSGEAETLRRLGAHVDGAKLIDALLDDLHALTRAEAPTRSPSKKLPASPATRQTISASSSAPAPSPTQAARTPLESSAVTCLSSLQRCANRVARANLLAQHPGKSRGLS
jgi:hypothetical protein